MTVEELYEWLGELMVRSPGSKIAPVYACARLEGWDAIVDEAIDYGHGHVYLVAPGLLPRNGGYAENL